MTKYPATMTWRNASYLPVGFDLNNLVGGSGFFEVDTPTNGPGTGVWFVTAVKSAVDGKMMHSAVKKDAPDKAYLRTYSGSAWSSWLSASASAALKASSVAAKTTSATLTASELLGGILTGNQGGGAGAAYTLPLATDLETALLALYPGLAVGDTFEFSVLNISTNAAEDITMTTNTGWTLVGNMVVESNEATAKGDPVARFAARRTAANTYTLYRVA